MSMSITSPIPSRLAELEAALEDVRASRPAASRVLAMTNDPSSTAATVAGAIDADPMMSAQVLRLANSAAYGMAERVQSTQVAVGLVGFSAVRSIAVLLASGLRNRRTPAPANFWTHSASTGAACAVLSGRFGVARGDAFSLGLLHDIGTAILHTVDPIAYDEIATDEPDSVGLCMLEMFEFGLSHADAAARVLEGWNFPEGFVAAVARHHELGRGGTPLEQVLLAGDAVSQLISDPNPDDAAHLERLATLGVPAEVVPDLTRATVDYAAEVLAGLPT
jgi:HD-like signal output (HDOD) protein